MVIFIVFLLLLLIGPKELKNRLTIMIVPHSEKKILNIQISNLVLIMFSFTLLITIALSIYSIIDTNKLIQMSNKYKNTIQNELPNIFISK